MKVLRFSETAAIYATTACNSPKDLNLYQWLFYSTEALMKSHCFACKPFSLHVSTLMWHLGICVSAVCPDDLRNRLHSDIKILMPFGVTWSMLNSSEVIVLPTFCGALVDRCLTNVSGPIGCPETSVNNYEPTLRENPKDRRLQLQRGWSLKPRMDSSGS